MRVYWRQHETWAPDFHTLPAVPAAQDEVPELVNAEILRFIERSVLPRMAAGAAAGGRPAAVAGVEQ